MSRLVDEEFVEEPGQSELLTSLGRVHLGLGHWNEAIEALTRALGLAPDDADACFHRGKAYWEIGEHQRALDDFDHAIALLPDEPQHHVHRANALGKLDRLAEAVEAVSRGITLAPEYAPAYALRAIYRTHVDETEEGLALVEADLARAIELAPGEAMYVRKRGEYLMGLEQYSAAIPDFDRAIALAPDVAALHYGRGFCRSRLTEEGDLWSTETDEERQARCALAMADLERAVALGQIDEEVFHALLCVREEMRDEAGFLATLERGLAAVPDAFSLRALRLGRRRRAGDLAGADADRAHMVALGYPVEGL